MRIRMVQRPGRLLWRLDSRRGQVNVKQMQSQTAICPMGPCAKMCCILR